MVLKYWKTPWFGGYTKIMSFFILLALPRGGVCGGGDTTERYVKCYSFSSKHKQQVGDFENARCWPKHSQFLQKWVVKLLLTSTMHGFKNTTFGFLCNKIELQLIHSTHGLPSSWLFQNRFCYTKAKKPNVWLYPKEREFCFLYLEVIMLLFLTASWCDCRAQVLASLFSKSLCIVVIVCL